MLMNLYDISRTTKFVEPYGFEDKLKKKKISIKKILDGHSLYLKYKTAVRLD